MQNQKAYPFWEHYRYTFHYLWEKMGGTSLAVCAGDVVLSILLPFLEAALAGAVAACLLSGRQTAQILALVAGYIVLLQTVRFSQSHVRLLRRKLSFLFRGKKEPELDKKILEMDGQSCFPFPFLWRRMFPAPMGQEDEKQLQESLEKAVSGRKCLLFPKDMRLP